jgi:hypothetical protein
MQSETFRKTDTDINIRYRANGNLFHLWCLQTIITVKETVLLTTAPLITMKQEVRAEMDSFSAACNNLHFIVWTKKIEMIFHPSPGKQY